MNQQNKTERWEDKFDDEFAVNHNSWGDDFQWADNSNAKATKIKSFIHQLLSDTRREASAEGFKKGYIKGALDKEWGQTTAEEEIEKIKEEARREVVEIIKKSLPTHKGKMISRTELKKSLDQISQSIEEGIVK